MHFKGRMKLEYGAKQIDILPLINIIFLILLFLMFSPSLVTQAGMKINLPKAVTSVAVRNGIIEIIVNAENSVFLNGKIVDTDDLSKIFKETAKRNQAVLIKADRSASLGKLVAIWDLARDSGITQINIATN